MDNYTKYISSLIKKPQILLPQKHLFLLSHMRANTSLMGHIIGDHDGINGYYEMHIGYYSWKSLIRQKLHYFSTHSDDKVKTYIFDKILHNGHGIAPAILNHKSCYFLICLREPLQTIKSAVSQFRKTHPTHEFTDVLVVCDYYIKRLEQLTTYGKALNGNYLYYDAASLVDATQNTLHKISDYLQLNTPLQPKFKTQKLTGKGNAGDHSGNLLHGQIVQKQQDYSDIIIPAHMVDNLSQHFDASRTSLISHCVYEQPL
jgi:hypothetical protein